MSREKQHILFIKRLGIAMVSKWCPKAPKSPRSVSSPEQLPKYDCHHVLRMSDSRTPLWGVQPLLSLILFMTSFVEGLTAPASLALSYERQEYLLPFTSTMSYLPVNVQRISFHFVPYLRINTDRVPTSLPVSSKISQCVRAYDSQKLAFTSHPCSCNSLYIPIS